MSQYKNSYVEVDDRTYGKGAIGALLGAIVGAIGWAIIFKLGYVIGLLGLVIGFLACKGYDLMKGKQGKGKIVILILAVIFSVLLGTAGGFCWDVLSYMDEMGIPAQYFGEYMELLLQEESLVGAIIGDTVQGLLFAAIGVVGFIVAEGRKISAQNKPEE